MTSNYIYNVFIAKDRMVALHTHDVNKGYAVVPEYVGIRSGAGLIRYIQSLHQYQRNQEIKSVPTEGYQEHMKSQLQ